NGQPRGGERTRQRYHRVTTKAPGQIEGGIASRINSNRCWRGCSGSQDRVKAQEYVIDLFAKAPLNFPASEIFPSLGVEAVLEEFANFRSVEVLLFRKPLAMDRAGFRTKHDESVRSRPGERRRLHNRFDLRAGSSELAKHIGDCGPGPIVGTILERFGHYCDPRWPRCLGNGK